MICMEFDDEGKVGKITIATIHLQPLTEANRTAIQRVANEHATSG
jgi:hypothetical protein